MERTTAPVGVARASIKGQAGDARITDAILTPRTDMRRTALAVHTNSR